MFIKILFIHKYMIINNTNTLNNTVNWKLKAIQLNINLLYNYEFNLPMEISYYIVF